MNPARYHPAVSRLLTGMKMITPGIADSMTPHGWYDRKEPKRPEPRARRVRLPHLHLHVPHLNLPHLRPRHPQA